MASSTPTAPSEPPPTSPPPPSADPAPTAQTLAGTPQPTAAPANPPRLVIDRLTLQNFKSYGGVVHVGPFHTSFSSIVGPNGSGKSNVIDAMLFVFGRRAKALRHNKLSELLHHSPAYPNVDSASVTVYFSEIVDGPSDGQFEPVGGSQFAVCRRAFRNNTSKYYIDGKEVKMAHVVSVLKGKGVDLDNNRFLILQGEVEQIAMMKPKGVAVGDEGLLEYLEDIIGSGRFVEQIESSGKRVEELNEERGHKLNRVKAAERERNGLESAKIEAEDYLDKERVLLGKKLALCRAALAERLENLSINEKDMKEKETEFDEFKKEMKGKDDELKGLESVFKETQKNADIAVKTMNKAKDEYTTFERRDIKLREDMKAFNARLKKLDGVKKSEEKRVNESEGRVKAFEKEKEDANVRVKELQNELQVLEQELDKVRDQVREKTAGVRRELEEKQTEKLPFSEKVNEARKQLDVTQSELKLVIEKLEAPKLALREAEERLAKMEESAKNSKDSVLKLQAEERELNERINLLKREQAEGMALQPELSTTVSNLRRRLEEAKAAKEDVHTRSRLHNGILRASRNGVLQGVVGRLGDLASVDAEYAAAVGAAAGSTLDCIVVKTAENAQACIQFLRRENLGRATFVILEKIEYLRRGMDEWGRSGRSADGPRLFDYLRIPKPEHRTAMYYALRDTLVADTLESARRMAFKPTRQNRVVSLAGELIESSGAMSGGGRGPSKYRLGSGSGGEAPLDPAELQRLEEKYEDSKRQGSDLHLQLQEIDNKIRLNYSRLDELQVLFGKARMESESFTSRIAYMRNQTLPGLMKAVTDADKRVRNESCEDTKQRIELEEKVSVGERKLSGAQKACEALESDISTLQERIVAMGGSKLQEATDAVGNCRGEISESQSVASRASSRATAAIKAKKKAEGAAKAAEQEMEAKKKKIEEAKQMSDSMLDDAEKVLEKFKETEEVHKEWEEKLGEVQKEYSEVKGRLKELRRRELSLSETVQNARALVTRDRLEVGNLKKQEKSVIGKMKKTSLASVATVVQETEEEDGDSMRVVEEKDAEDDDDVEAMEGDEGSEAADKNGEEEDNDGASYEGFKLSAQEHKQLTMEAGVLESDLSKLTPNLGAIAEYKSKDEEYRGQVNELDALTQMRDTARRECDGLRKARLDEFMSGFSVITLKLKELYQMITLGGDAELELVDSLDPFSEGIVFSVRPPKKSWKNISNLSGGEKTLSSLALVFALHHFKPTPLYFLDEIDAALDYKNVSIVANYVKERTKNAQFIIISLRNNMFELADRLVGIYKTYNVTKSVSIDPGAFVMPQPLSGQEDVAA